MKNITFLDQMKCIIKNDCNNVEENKAEIQKEEIEEENTVSKLDFQLFDIDQVFAN
jgi:hypothetical protein